MNSKLNNKLVEYLNSKSKNFKLALVHRSIIGSQNDKIETNERLEFLGDAVLEIVITELLFDKFPNNNEGELTEIRSATVKKQTLAMLSKQYGIDKLLIMSKGEERTGGREKDYILANSFEAIIGAYYKDNGFTQTKEMLSDIFASVIKQIVDKNLQKDPKSILQQYIQDVYKKTPFYILVEESGPDHNKSFVVQAYIDESTPLEVGSGNTKQAAETEAAKLSMQRLINDIAKG